MTLPSFLRAPRDQVEDALEAVRSELPDTRIGGAMKTALAAPGKRIRPIATLLAARALEVPVARCLPFALAIELVHTSSLVLDDLPCMDDSPVRRGEPALHVRVGEADAVLTGLALLSQAHRLVASTTSGRRRRPDLVPRLLELLHDAVGPEGMCEGQSLDLAFDAAEKPGFAALEGIHRRKTGALFAAALEGPGLIAAATTEEIAALLHYGRNLGLAFQIADDILDARGDPARMGKPAGRDHGRRTTFVSLFGVDQSVRAIEELHGAARRAAASLGPRADSLVALVDFLEHRDG